MRTISGCLAYLVSFWTKAKERHVFQHGRTLNPLEKEYAQKLKISQIDKIRILEVEKINHPFSLLFSLFAQFARAVISSPIGLTLGYSILIEKRYALRLDLIVHELVHVSQYEKMGGHQSFLKEYIYQCVSRGYLNSALEMEAEELSLSILSRNQS